MAEDTGCPPHCCCEHEICCDCGERKRPIERGELWKSPVAKATDEGEE